MAGEQLKPVATGLLLLNLCMYVIVLAIAASTINKAIDHGFIIGPGFELPAHFSPIYFPMGNAATGFFVLFSLIAGVVGAASALTGIHHIRSWNAQSLASASSVAIIAWTLTLLALGLAFQEMDLHVRNACFVRVATAFFMLSYSHKFHHHFLYFKYQSSLLYGNKNEMLIAEICRERWRPS